MPDNKEKVFEQLYKKHYAQVYGYIRKKISDEQTAEDIAMDAFYSCWSKFEEFDESKASFQTWLFVVVNNKLKNYYRGRKETVDVDDVTLYEADCADEIIESIHLQEMRDHLYVALQKLSETQRTIVIYKYFQNMNATEIGERLDMSPGNVRVQLNRAIEKIRAHFETKGLRWE